MELILTCKDLLASLKIAKLLTKNCGGLLCNCSLRSVGGRAQLRVTNRETEVAFDLGSAGEEFDIVVSATDLYNAISGISAKEEVRLIVGTEHLSICAADAIIRLLLIPVEDYRHAVYPDFNDNALSSFSLPEFVFKDGLHKVRKFVAKNDVREYITGLLVDLHHKSPDSMTINLVGTNGHRLALYETGRSPDTTVDARFIVPAVAVDILHGILGKNAGPVLAKFAGEYGKFVISNITVVTKLLSGNYPDYWRVFPNKPSKHCIVSRLSLKEALAKALPLVSRPLNGVTLQFRENAILVTVPKTCEIKVMAGYNGNDTDIIYNIHYLLDVVTTSDSNELKFSFNDHIGPTLVTTDSDSTQYLVMPMKP